MQEASASLIPEHRERWTYYRARLSGWYIRHEKYAGLAFFSLGFLWDSLTFTRVDNPIDNLILLFYLAVIGRLIIFVLRRQSGIAPTGWAKKLEPHYLWIMQFCFGGLFSCYVVCYFKSVSWTRTQFFFMILVILLIGNEFLKDRMQNPELLAVLYSFCLFSFFAFFLPVVLARIHSVIFFLAGVFSLIISISIFFAGYRAHINERQPQFARVVMWIFATFLTINLFYSANLIPPVPLALKAAGIYHKIVRQPGGYEVQYVPPPFYRFWARGDDPFYLTPGESAYCYTSIFAPRNIHIPVRHIWSRWVEGKWAQTDRMGFAISGGREKGYRGYTKKNNLAPGKWRVEVETVEGQILGRIDFTVLISPIPHPQLMTKLIR
jgi:hypothetical protein